MTNHDISPLTVAEYSKDFIIDTVRHFTGWNERGEVSEKAQLKYLFGYLSSNHVLAKTVLVENEYIDRNFLEDYSRYYARCFDTYSKTCARIHFFKNPFTEHEFINALTSNDETFIKDLSENYIGFVVIRPIPDTFIARMCLRPYNYFNNSPSYKLILTKTKISLFGITLEFETTAFIEQDRVVSECATSSIWTLLSTDVANIKHDGLPSLSTITQIASSSSNDGTKTYPNGGLTYKQVSSALKHFDLEPHVIEVESEEKLRELVYAYVSNDIPILLGGEIYTKERNGYVNKGRHFTCILGYHLSEENKDFKSDRVDKMYIHDDRLGPFVRLNATAKAIGSTGVTGFDLVLYDGSSQYINTEVLIIGLYHKIRLPYDVIKDIGLALGCYLEVSNRWIENKLAEGNVTRLSHKEFLEYQEYLTSVTEGINNIIKGQWEIALTTNSKIKEELILNNNYFRYNGSDDKASVLIRSMPKYVWRIRVTVGNENFTDVLIDATAVPQGNLILGVFAYNESVDNVWRYVEEKIKYKEWQNVKLENDLILHENNIKPFFKFYSKSNSNQSLNALYGYLGLPRREPKPGELDGNNNIHHRFDVHTIRNSTDTSWEFLETKTKYIWVIDEFGGLVVGEDVEVNNEYGGHPTLIDNKPARLGGELIWNMDNNKWNVNLSSGTYSRHLDKESAKAAEYLQNVIKNNLNGLKVEIQQ